MASAGTSLIALPAGLVAKLAARFALTQRQTVAALVFLTAGSQGLGLIRDFLLARAFAITADLEGYLFAESIPLAVTVMFVTVIPLTILPRFVHMRTRSVTQCDAMYRSLVQKALIVLLPALALILVFAPQIIGLIGSELSPESRLVAQVVLQALAVNVIGVPILSLNAAYLNAQGSFVVPAVALLLTNLGAIIGLWLGGETISVAIGSSLGTLLAVIGTYALIRTQLTPAPSRTMDRFTLRVPPNVIYVAVYVLMLSVIVLLERRVSSAMGFGTVTLIAYVTKIVGVPQHLFTMSFVRVRIAQYARWSTAGQHKAIRQDFQKSIMVMMAATAVCVAGAALGGVHIAELLFGQLAPGQSAEFQQATIVLSIALLPMFVNALFIGVASANERLIFLLWPSAAQAVVLGAAALLLPNGLGAVAVAGVVAIGHIAASLVWLGISRQLFATTKSPMLAISVANDTPHRH